jgi:hypothetical protein
MTNIGNHHEPDFILELCVRLPVALLMWVVYEMGEHTPQV